MATEAATSQQRLVTHNTDHMSLQNSDNPGMILVTAPLIGNNYWSWSRAMKIALGAKQRLVIIDSIVKALQKDSDTYENWRKCDFMVTSWILNSILKDLLKPLFIQTQRKIFGKNLKKGMEKVTTLLSYLPNSKKD